MTTLRRTRLERALLALSASLCCGAVPAYLRTWHTDIGWSTALTLWSLLYLVAAAAVVPVAVLEHRVSAALAVLLALGAYAAAYALDHVESQGPGLDVLALALGLTSALLSVCLLEDPTRHPARTRPDVEPG